MHCRNVVAEPMTPPAPLSKKFQRKTGRPLTRYHVLRIEPMRSVLDREGSAESKGLEYAVHTCRGHFKEYTADAPLFGRFTGQWWWSEHNRGTPSAGIVTKDYSIGLPPEEDERDGMSDEGASER